MNWKTAWITIFALLLVGAGVAGADELTDLKSQVGDLEKKIEALSKALEINPDFSLAYNERGIAFAKTFKYERAIVDYDSALIRMPESAVIYFNKALSCDNAARFEEAREAYIHFLKFTHPAYTWYIIYANKRIVEINQYGEEKE